MNVEVGDKVTVGNGKTIYTVVNVEKNVNVVSLVNEKNNRRAIAYFNEITIR